MLAVLIYKSICYIGFILTKKFHAIIMTLLLEKQQYRMCCHQTYFNIVIGTLFYVLANFAYCMNQWSFKIIGVI